MKRKDANKLSKKLTDAQKTGAKPDGDAADQHPKRGLVFAFREAVESVGTPHVAP